MYTMCFLPSSFLEKRIGEEWEGNGGRRKEGGGRKERGEEGGRRKEGGREKEGGKEGGRRNREVK